MASFFLILIKRIYRICSINNIRLKVELRFPKAYFSPHCFFYIQGDIDDFKIGANSSIGEFSVIVIDSDKKSPDKIKGRLEIGDNTYIGELNNIRAAGGIIKIGNNCCISQHVTIVASNHSYKKDILICDQVWDAKKHSVFIGNDVWIGANVVILPGVRINNGAVIGAGTIVNKDVPENAVVVRNPAKVIKYRQ